MIMDARAHVDLIAMLHLETLSTTRHLDSASDQSNRTTHADTTIPHLQEQQALQLRHRLAVIQSLALRAQGLTIKTDMAKSASTRRNDAVSSQSPQNAAAAEEDVYRKNVW